MLRELAEIGMGLARGVARRAEDPEAAGGDLGLVYARIARAVRQTLALEAKLEGELAAHLHEETAARETALAQAARAPIQQRAKTLRRAVRQAIEAEVDELEVEDLFDALDERLADREDDPDFLDRPIAELVTRICKDLGVTPDPTLWEDEDWARTPATTSPPPSSEAQSNPPTHASVSLRPAGAPSWLSG